MKIIPNPQPILRPGFLEEFQQLPRPKTGGCITNLRGTLTAPLLLLCEHPTPLELEANAPFCDLSAKMYCSMLDQLGFDHEKNFLIVPHSRFGIKPNKASTTDMLPFLQAHLPQRIKCIVCVGIASFGFTFSGGRKTHAQTIIGNPMYLPKLRTLPVYVLPDSALLALATANDWREKQRGMEHAEKLQNLMLNLKSFVEEKLNVIL